MLKRKIIGLLSVVMLLVLVMPLTVLAESDQEKEYENVVPMTAEEVDAILISHGVYLDKDVQLRAGLSKSSIYVDKVSGGISVAYYTEASIVANRIGVTSLDLCENSTAVVSDYEDYNCFVQSYRGGFVYTAARSGRSYYAAGTNFAILTTTHYNQYNVSNTEIY